VNITKVVKRETLQQDCHTGNLVEDIHGTLCVRLPPQCCVPFGVS
jgi:hypothetical protein